MADLSSSFMDFRSLTSKLPLKHYSSSLVLFHNSTFNRIKRRQFHVKLISNSKVPSPSSELDVISTHEHSDGSLLFRFGDPSEIAKNIEEEECETVHVQIEVEDAPDATVQGEIESEAKDEYSTVKVLEDAYDSEAMVKNLDRDVNVSSSLESSDNTNSVAISKESVTVVDEENVSTEELLEDSNEIESKEIELLEVSNELQSEKTEVTFVEIEGTGNVEGSVIQDNEDSSPEHVSMVDESSKIENNITVEESPEKEIAVVSTLQSNSSRPEACADFEHRTEETELRNEFIDEIEAQPEPTMSLPEEIEAQSEPVTSISEEIEAQSEPAMSLPEEIEAQSEPALSLHEEIETQSEPATDLSEEIEAQSEPATSLSEEIEVQSEPATNLSEEILAQSEPATNLSEEIEAQSEPATNLSEEIEAQSEPATNLSEEIEAQSEPATSISEEIEAQSEPATSIYEEIEAQNLQDEMQNLKIEDDCGNDTNEAEMNNVIIGDGSGSEANLTVAEAEIESSESGIEEKDELVEDGSRSDVIESMSVSTQLEAEPTLDEETRNDILNASQENEEAESLTMHNGMPRNSILESEKTEDDDNALPSRESTVHVKALIHEATTNFVLSSGAVVLPHPSKVLTGGDDAYFVAGQKWLGVADAIGEWSLEGTSPGIYARELMENCESLVSNCTDKSINNPLELLKLSVAETHSPGSSAVLVAQFDGQALHVANIGDSGFIILRHGTVYKRSSPIVHGFHFPLQIKKGEDPSHLAELDRVDLEEEDVIITATDGIFDNLYDQEICSIVMKSLAAGKKLEEIAELLAKKAQEIGKSAYVRSPFADNAQAAGYAGYTGGKLDDVAVIVSVVRRKSSS